ncbi:putative polyphosphate kinase [Helianthus annuus]|nr:putative polyphosphate kinase [Helianthus annuus]
MCSYLLIGFWFTRPVAAKACQKAFVTSHVGDFGLLLGILGFYWITESFEFRDLFQTFNNLISNNEVNSVFVTLCAVLLFAGAIAKKCWLGASNRYQIEMATAVDAVGEPIPTSAVLMSASKHIAGKCRGQNIAFLKCKKDDPNPEKCLDKGNQVTRCVHSFI